MAKYRDPKVKVASSYAATRRTIRRPSHPFQLRTRPFQIQPFLMAPVLPGETVQNIMVQSRVVTDPIKHPLIGWWTEYFLFYVKHRDIAYHMGNNVHEAIVLDPTFDPAPLHSAADPKTYHAWGINWTQHALETIVEYFFRDQGEDWNVATLDGLPLSQYVGKSWLDSMTRDEDKRDTDVNVDLNDDGDITAREIMEAQAHWEALREAGLEDMDYEDFIRTYGVQTREVEESPNLYRPELLRYNRSWSYPTNTVNPEDGVPASAVSWTPAFRADKRRFIKEPGFVVGLTVCRPKVYIADQRGALAGGMNNVYSWLPAVLQADYEKGFRQFADGTGPLGDEFGQGYWIDIRDLFTYGDQFLNFVPDAASSAMNVLTAEGGKRYPTETDIDNLFAGSERKGIRQDGIVNLAIAGRQQDRSRATTI